MKKASLLVLIAAGLALAFAGCTLEVKDPIESSTWTAYLGGEDVYLNVESVTKNGINLLNSAVSVGTAGPGTLAWNAYDLFLATEGIENGDVLVYTFHCDTPATDNWKNWAFALKDDATGDVWYLRADAWSNSTLPTNASVAYTSTWNWDDFATVFDDKDIVLTVTKGEAVITAQASIGGTVVYTATAQ
ncbi:MAG: hypothetical protein JXP39_02330 [Spirochaetales bacterium]|nr:hypothetical protein [Spirochaetales bacterium]